MRSSAYNNSFLMRVAGLPLRVSEVFTFSNAVKHYDEYKTLTEKLDTISTALTDDIFAYISSIDNELEKNSFLNLKRDIFNKRVKKVERYSIKTLPEAIQKQLAEWKDIIKQIKHKELAVEDVLNRELKEKRVELQKHFSDKEFIKAIQLSNFSFYNRLLEYTSFEDMGKKLPRKLRNTELSLINYLNRMIYKPSPFSSFSGLSHGKFVNDKTKVTLDRDKSHSFCRVNMSYLKAIELKLLDITAVKEQASYSLNSTISFKDTRVSCLKRGLDGTVNAFKGEKMIEFQANDLIKTVYSLFNDEQTSSYKKLFELLQDDFQLKSEDCQAVIGKLEQIGLIRPFIVVPEQHIDYIGEIIKVLEQVDDERASKSAQLLKELLNIQQQFGNAGYQERALYLKKLKGCLQNIFQFLEVDTHILETSLIFEDVEYPQTTAKIDIKKGDNFRSSLEVVQQLMALFDDSIIQKIALKTVYLKTYPERGENNLLDFYLKYQSYDKSQLWEEVKHDSTFLQIKQLRYKFYDYLEKKIEESNDTLELDIEWVKQFIKDYPKELISDYNYSFYCQLMTEGDEEQLILNKLGPGLFRHYSRYCNLFLSRDEKHPFVRDIKDNYKYLEEKKGEVLFTDLNAVLGLNINMHPPMIEQEITYPGCCPNSDISQIKIEELTVYLDETSEKIRMKSAKSKKVIELVPLGFLFPMIAPQLYSFLSFFCQSNGVEYSFWNKYCAEKKKEGYNCFPRIKLGDVILDRKTWSVPKSYFDFSKSEEKYFFENIDTLRRAGIDREVFIKISSAMDAFKEEYINSDFTSWIEEVKNTKLRKPQYINFKSLFHQQIFKKLVEKTEKNVMFQEVLPNRQHSFEDSEHLFELLIEFE